MPTVEQEIDDVDLAFSMFTEAWKDAVPEQKEKWMQRIEAALESRWELMRERDGNYSS